MVGLPNVGGDVDVWGPELNAYMSVEHRSDGSHAIGTSPSTGQDITYSDDTTPKLINISHMLRPGSYRNFAGNGAMDGSGTDDSAVLNKMFSDANSAGRYAIEFPNRIISCKNVVAAYPNLHVDFNGATLVQASTSTTSDDLVRGWNFTTLTGTNTQVTAGTVPYQFILQNGTLFQPSGVGRHVLALYGYSFNLTNLKLFEQGVGAALVTEYGSATEVFTSGTPPKFFGDAGMVVDKLWIHDAPGGTPITAYSANDMSLTVTTATQSGGTTMTIVTSRFHYLTTGMTVTVAGVTGSGTPNGTFTVTVVDASTFTYTTTGLTGTYSGGTVTYHVSAGWLCYGPHDSHVTNVLVINNSSRGTSSVNGRRGVLVGSNGQFSATGIGFDKIHVYDNWDVGVDVNCGSVVFGGDTELEGASKCILLLRGSRTKFAGGEIFNGLGGVTMIDIRGNNQNIIRAIMDKGGGGQAPPSGFNTTYLYTTTTSDNNIQLSMQHDFNTNAAATAGTAPTHSFLQIYMDAFGISTATLSAGWLTSIDATHAGIAMIPTGLTVTTG